MTNGDFRRGFALAAVAAVGLGAALRLALGAGWFSFYGLATVALVTLPVVTSLLWRRLPATGHSRLWSLVYAVPVGLVSLAQIVFWWLFFAEGGTNPTLGVLRSMLRPWIDAAQPFALMAFLFSSALVFLMAGRSDHTGRGAVGR